MSAPFIIPAFDPDSRDSLILEAQDGCRRLRAWTYSVAATSAGEAENEAAEQKIMEAEDRICGDAASTIPGIIARLQTRLTSMCDRWLDQTMSESGFLAVYQRIGELDGNDQQIVHAIHELYQLDWDQALSAYERAEEDLTQAGNVRAVTDRTMIDAQKRGETDGTAAEADRAADIVHNHFIDRSSDALRVLLKTLAPDHDAYLRKVQIMAVEGIDYALPWLARDTSFLIGQLYAAAPEGPRT